MIKWVSAPEYRKQIPRRLWGQVCLAFIATMLPLWWFQPTGLTVLLVGATCAAHGEALMGVSLFDAQAQWLNVYDLPSSVDNQIDLIVDIGELYNQPSTVLDLTEMPPTVLRQGSGDASAFV